MKGKVFLVGAGPGDVGLLTIKGLKVIEQADVILYDRLINPRLLESAPSHCEFIFCGKLPSKHTLDQDMINEQLVLKALEGKVVVRLKGGDPGVFGRVGEEAEVLASYKIPFEIVPGITSGIAAPIYAGIPVTHRKFGVSFTIVSAHDKSKGGKPVIDWNGLVRSSETIAFYMGVSNLPYICENLIHHGKSADTPVILIQWGTYGRQRTLQGTLSDIVNKVKESGFQNPAITLVGQIVSLRENIQWFEKKPFYGRQILLARTNAGRSSIAEKLQGQGADVIEFPKWIRKKVPADKKIVNQIFSYDQILFTSSDSIDEFFDIVVSYGLDIRNIRANLYCLSNKSLETLKSRGLTACSYKNMKMEQYGKILVVGDRRVGEQRMIREIELVRHDYFQTSKVEIDEKFIPILKRMFDEASIDTVIFPNRSSVEAVMSVGEKWGFPIGEIFKDASICGMGKRSRERTEDWGHPLDFKPMEPGIENIINGYRDQRFNMVKI